MGIDLKCNNPEKSIASASPMVGEASTGLRKVCERGSCKEDHSGTHIECFEGCREMRMQDAMGRKRPTNRRARQIDVYLFKRRCECEMGLSSWHPNRISGS